MGASRERLTIRGAVGAAAFGPWIERAARKLGLSGGVVGAGPGAVELVVAGHPDMIDALEVACSLGPIEVAVDRIDREALAEG